MPRQPEGVRRPPDATLDEAQHLLDTGMPFHAHEVLEDAWKAAAEPERALWKGLAQIAVGLTHAARGNPVGAATLLRRGADAIAPYAPQAPYRIDVARLVKWAQATAADLAAGGEPQLSAPGLRSVQIEVDPRRYEG